MGFKPMAQLKIIFSEVNFHFIKYQNESPKIQALMGFKPMTKYFPAFEISNKKAYEI